LLGAAIGAAAGAWSWTLTDLWCPVAYVPHLLLGHVLPVALLAIAGLTFAPGFLRGAAAPLGTPPRSRI
jgi:hypothetical protein